MEKYQFTVSFAERMMAVMSFIEFMADEKLQDDVWIKKNHFLSSYFSAEEMYCELFDDTFFEHFIEHEIHDGNLSKTQILAFQDIHAAIKVFEDTPGKFVTGQILNTETLHKDSDWQKLMQVAKKTVEIINKSS